MQSQNTISSQETGLSAAQVDLQADVQKGKKSASAFRTISEVADELGVQQHVLRFWETKFTHIKPLKRGGGRRYYRPEDVDLLRTIHRLLYTEGYTIKGVQKLLREQGKKQVVQKELKAENLNAPASPQKHSALSEKQRSVLTLMLNELKELRDMIKAD